MARRRKRFNSYKAAVGFCKKVGGQLNDLTSDSKSKSKYSVTYQPSQKTRSHWNRFFVGQLGQYTEEFMDY